MLYSEIIAVCSQIHTKHINALFGPKVELLNVKLAVHIMTTGLYSEEHNGISVCHTSLLIPPPRYAAPRFGMFVTTATISLGNMKCEIWWDVTWRLREIV